MIKMNMKAFTCMRRLNLILLLGFILASIFILPGCSMNNVLNRTSNIKEELKEKGGLHVVLSPKNLNGGQISKDQYKKAIAIMDYRLESIGYNKRNISVDDSGKITVEVVYNKDIVDPGMQLAVDYVTKTGLFTIQEVDEGKKDEKGAYLPTNKVVVNGIDIKDAKAMDDKDKGINIMIKLTDKASKNFEEATERLVGKPLGIYMDNQMLSAPVVQAKISGGKVVITNQKSKEEAINLLTIIKSGPLPFELEQISIQHISANKK